MFNSRTELAHSLQRVIGVTAFVSDTARATQREAEVAAQALEIRYANRRLSEAKRQLEHERGLREQFVLALSHDLRAPLPAATMGAHVSGHKAQEADEVRRINARVLANLERIDHMLRNLLDAGRFNAAGALKLSIDESRAARHCRIGDRRPEHGAWGPVPPGVRRSAHRTLGLPCAEARHREPVQQCDPPWPAEGPVTVRLRALPEHAGIEVHDAGEPIPLQDQAAIFTAHFRGNGHGREGRSGWGLGLTVVHGLVDAHGGSIDLESTPRDGTTLRVRLPFNAGAAGSDR